MQGLELDAAGVEDRVTPSAPTISNVGAAVSSSAGSVNVVIVEASN